MESANPQRSTLGDRRLAVVSGYGLKKLTPRGQRTRWVVDHLEQSWDVELTALPAEDAANGAASGSGRAPWRRLAGDVVRTALLDKWEPWSAQHLGRWQPQVAGGMLIAYPWSPVTYAARRLRRAGLPYVVDAGDPWVLTSPGTDTRLLAKYRSRRAEREIWSGAAGAVVTTRQQADVIASHFPALPILVRPNGYDPIPEGAVAPARAVERDPEHLRIVHYGMLTFVRVDVAKLLERLVASGRWRSISFIQYGDDHAGMLARAPASVEVEFRPAQPWDEVVTGASQYDVAIVVGNWLTGQLPSKAVQYMTLPIPRLALSERESDDALAEYVSGRPAWLALAKDELDPAERLWQHVERHWSRDELAPPAEEAWPRVAERIGGFVEQCISDTAAPRTDREQAGRGVQLGTGGA